MTRDNRRFFFGPNAPLLLRSPYGFFNSRNESPANFLELRGLFSLRVKCQFLQQYARERRVLAEIFVMRLVNIHELIEQEVMRLRCPKGFVGHRCKFLIEDEKNQIPLILRIIEQSSQTDVGTPGDLAKRSRVVSMLGEKFTGSRTDPLTFFQLVLFPEPKLRR